MTFIQPAFLALLLIVLAVYWGMSAALHDPDRARRGQNLLLLAASAVFYGWVHPWYLGLLAFSTLLDYGVALGIERHPRHRRALLALSLTGNLGLLGTFKYLGFFVANVAAVLTALGVQPHLPVLQIALPVGISFFTFQTLSYTLDVYRGRIRARSNLIEYATFVCLFPQLVAGPVERARSLLPQIEAPRSFRWAGLRSGLGLALWGAAKKVVIADTLALYVDRVFAMHHAGPLLTWAATLGFAVQILADFSGYTDIARGTARMLGFELMENFRRPYLAASPSEFWRRWHISFSSWIHEYLYLPLCGQDRGRLRTLLARYGALLLSGLWHGAAWNFVLWGGFHATLLTAWKATPWRAPRWLTVPGMFACTTVGWLLFRQGDLGELFWTLRWAPWSATADERIAAAVMASIAVLGAGVLGLASLLELQLLPRLGRWRLPVETGLWALAAFSLLLFARDSARDFIYFRF